jgi:hypothetical protein
MLTPRILDNLLLIPRVTHWPQGYRAEVVIDDLGLGDIWIDHFAATREEAAERAMATLNNWPPRSVGAP